MRKKMQNALIKIDEEKKGVDFGVINFKPCFIEEPESKEEDEIDLNNVFVGVHRVYDDVSIPKYYTEKSACFDLPSYLGPEIVRVDVYNRMLMHVIKTVAPMADRDGVRGISIDPGECAYIPTGLIFDIPEKYKIAIYPRSGVSSKRHIKLSNCVAVIDEDFTQQTMLLIFNNSEQRQTICHGDRLAQAEIVPVYRAIFEEMAMAVPQKTDRKDGLGHTGLIV